MGNPASSTVQNLLPVQAYFDVYGNFITFIGQGQPFTATISPYQSGLHITNSTIDSTTIGATTPSTGVFTSGQVNATPVNPTDIANKLYVDSVAAGLSWKEPFQVATTATNSLSMNLVLDTESFFGNASATSGSAAYKGIFGLSKDKTKTQFTLYMGDDSAGSNTKTITGNCYVTGLAPTVSADSPVWVTPVTLTVSGEYTVGTATSDPT